MIGISRISAALAVCSALFIASSCVNEVQEEGPRPEFITGINVTGEDVDISAFDTKVTYDASMRFNWSQEGDVIGIFPMGGYQQTFPLSNIKAGSATALFDGGDWALRADHEYAAYYPFNRDNFLIDDMAIPVSYIGQKQVGNNSTANLGEFSYMASEATMPDAKGSVNLDMKQVGAIVRIVAGIPAGVNVVKATLTDETSDFIVGGKVDLSRRHSGSSAYAPVIEDPVYAPSISIAVQDLTTAEVAEGQSNVTLFFWMAPQDLTGHELALKLTDDTSHSYTIKATCTKALARAKGNGLSFGSSGSADFECLCFTALEANSRITIQKRDYAGTWQDPPALEYSMDGENWTEYEYGRNLYLSYGEKVYVRGDNEHFSVSPSHEINFEMSGRIAASGSIMYLLDKNGNRDSVGEHEFSWLFSDCKALIQAPELPSMNLGKNCYHGMFYNTGLTEAPELPATVLAEGCYWGMFSHCAYLRTAPAINAEILAEDCCRQMFWLCTNLTYVPDLPAMKLAPNCYNQMFDGCSALENPPALPAKVMETGCYLTMFSECASLKRAPALPAETLAERCYRFMFYKCPLIEEAPELPAETLAYDCYNSMFEGTAIKRAPELKASTLAASCYAYMFQDCKSLVEAPVLRAEELADECYYRMFEGCTSLASAPELPAERLAYSCYMGMFFGCTALESAPALPARTLEGRCYMEMFKNCTSLTTAPVLNARILASECYKSMFSGCSNLNSVTALFINPGSDVTDWLSGVSPTGTFFRNSIVNWTPEQAGIPEGWNIREGAEIYGSLAELVAAGDPGSMGKQVIVTLNREEITSITDNQEALFIEGSYGTIEIFCPDVPYIYLPQGVLSGTISNCVWKKQDGVLMLCPEDWTEFVFEDIKACQLNITADSFEIMNSSVNGYARWEGQYTKEAHGAGRKAVVTFETSQVMPSNGLIQGRAGSGTITNVSDFGIIRSIEIENDESSSPFTYVIDGGNFVISADPSHVSRALKITITFIPKDVILTR